MKKIKKTICPLDCPDSCGMLALVEDGKVISLRGDPEHPYTNGFICRKMRRYPERLYSSNRILYPQLRVGKKGDGRFKQISWEEAWNIIISRFKGLIDEYGSETILPFSYAGNMGALNRFAGFPLFHKMGTLQTMQTICSATAKEGWQSVCRDAGGSPPSVAASADLVIGWGINIRVSNVHFWRYVKKAKEGGARLLVIDPYENDTARAADDFIKILPGGDSGLALGVLKIMVKMKWVDNRFINEETDGFDQLSAYLQRTEIEQFERQSGVSKEQMFYLASLLKKNPKTFIRIGVGLTRNSRGGMAVRSIGSLAAACGLFDGGEGRGVLLFTGAFSGDSSKLTFPELASRKSRVINMIHLGQALITKKNPVRGLIVYNANPVSVVPDGTIVREALCRNDLFTVVHEQVMSPTARFADVLLPATTFLENRDIYTSYGHFYFGVADQVVEPVGETVSNFDFFQSFAQKMGYTDPPFYQSVDDRISSYLESIQGVPESFSAEQYRDGDYVESVYNVQNGSMLKRRNCRFRFVNSDCPNQPPFASLAEGGEFDHPDFISRFPFKLITPPTDKLLNSTFGEMYEGMMGDVLIHPEDAAEYTIVDGDRVALVNFRGKTFRRALVSDRTQKGLLVAEGLFWPGKRSAGTGINDLTSQMCSDMGGGTLFHESRVQVVPADSLE